MKQLAATLSRQQGIQYEFGPEFLEYSAKKAAGTLGETHLKPLSEIFSSNAPAFWIDAYTRRFSVEGIVILCGYTKSGSAVSAGWICGYIAQLANFLEGGVAPA